MAPCSPVFLFAGVAGVTGVAGVAGVAGIAGVMDVAPRRRNWTHIHVKYLRGMRACQAAGEGGRANPSCEVRLSFQHSRATCEKGISYGCCPSGNAIWVANCRGSFKFRSTDGNSINLVHCGYPPGNASYVCTDTHLERSGIVALPVAAALEKDGAAAIHSIQSFVHSVLATTPASASGSMALASIVDVGSNDGRWADAVMSAMKPSRRALVELTMVEPNPQFSSALRALAHKWHGEFVQAAAWTQAGEKVLHLGKNKESSSFVPMMARRYGHDKSMQTPTIDLAELLQRRIARWTLLKLDVEGAEYALLPYLIRRGTLCYVTHIIVEWHLNAIAPSERLGALGQRLALEATIRNSCAGSFSPLIVHAGYHDNNEGTRVPGLVDEVGRHERQPQAQPWESMHARHAKERASVRSAR